MGSLILVTKEQVETQGGGIDWGVWAAVVSAAAAVVALMFDGWRNRRQIAVSNMWLLIERWDGPNGRRLRAEAATYLLDHFPKETVAPKQPRVVVDVLDTLELLGYLVRTRTLRMQDVWINFPGAIQWWHVCRPIVEQYQRQDHTIYEDFAKLTKKLLIREVRQEGPSLVRSLQMTS